MSLKDTKILIPEISGEWTQRTRRGSTQIFNDSWHKNGLPEVRLEPPVKGLKAERIDGAWYWVCGCDACLGNNNGFLSSPCAQHDRCVTCDCTRAELTEAPWGGVLGRWRGWQCKPCESKQAAQRKAEALATAAAKGFGEDDCSYTDDILCPHCGSKQSADDIHQDAEGQECDVCEGVFDLELHYSVSYTTTKAKQGAV